MKNEIKPNEIMLDLDQIQELYELLEELLDKELDAISLTLTAKDGQLNGYKWTGKITSFDGSEGKF